MNEIYLLSANCNTDLNVNRNDTLFLSCWVINQITGDFATNQPGVVSGPSVMQYGEFCQLRDFYVSVPTAPLQVADDGLDAGTEVAEFLAEFLIAIGHVRHRQAPFLAEYGVGHAHRLDCCLLALLK